MESELEIMGISRIALEIIFSGTGWNFSVVYLHFCEGKQQKIPSVPERIICSVILETHYFWFRVHFFSGNNFFHLQFQPVLDRTSTVSKRNLETVPKDGTISGWNFHQAKPEQDRVNGVDKIARASFESHSLNP